MLDDVVAISRAIAREFEKRDLKPPSVIILHDHDQGMRMQSMLYEHFRQMVTFPSDWVRHVAHPDGSLWNEFEVAGIKYRYPVMVRQISTDQYVLT